jgi:hypothetical protein
MSLTKTITLPFTFHSRNGATFAPAVFDANNNQVAGRLDVIEHPPGTRLTLPADVADALLAKFWKQGAEEVGGDGVDVVALAAAA